jgi:hypothetical protein
MKEDPRWFREALEVLVRLISPLTVADGRMTAFMRDIERAARRYRRQAERRRRVSNSERDVPCEAAS